MYCGKVLAFVYAMDTKNDLPFLKTILVRDE